MSNTIINWRFLAWHLQVVQPGDWRSYLRDGVPIIRWSRNPYHARGGAGRREGWWNPVAFYEGRRYLLLIIALIALIVWAVL